MTLKVFGALCIHCLLLKFFQQRKFQTFLTFYLILGDPVPVAHDDLQLDLLQAPVLARQVEDEGFIEDGVETPLLDVGLLLRRPSVLVVEIDLHIWIWKPSSVE